MSYAFIVCREPATRMVQTPMCMDLADLRPRVEGLERPRYTRPLLSYTSSLDGLSAFPFCCLGKLASTQSRKHSKSAVTCLP